MRDNAVKVTRVKLLLLLLIAFPSVASAPAEDVWKMWMSDLRQQCPSSHVDWICGDCYDDLVGAFVQTLPSSTQQKISSIADYSRRCAEEKMGFSCEMFVHLDAFNRLRLLKRFTAFGCHRYRCEEPALCTRTLR